MTTIFRDIVQGTPQWHIWRNDFITASIVPALVNASPYETPYEAVQYLRGIRAKKVSDWLTKHGHEYEDAARECVEKKMGIALLPACVETEQCHYMAASLDGIEINNVPHEIKCPHEKQWNDVLVNGRNSTAYKMYRWQVCHQMYVTGSTVGYLHFFRDGDLISFSISKNDVAERIMLDACSKAWEHKTVGTLPAPSPHDVFTPEGLMREKLLPLAKAFKHASKQVRGAQLNFDKKLVELEVARDLLDSYGEPYKQTEFSNIKITRWSSKGNTDIEKFSAALAHNSCLELSEISDVLDKHKGSGSLQLKATIIGQKRRKSFKANKSPSKMGAAFIEGSYTLTQDEEDAFHLSAAVWRGINEEYLKAKADLDNAKSRLTRITNAINNHGVGFAGIEIGGVKITRFMRAGRLDINSAIKELSDVTGKSVHYIHNLLESTRSPSTKRIRIIDTLPNGSITAAA